MVGHCQVQSIGELGRRERRGVDWQKIRGMLATVDCRLFHRHGSRMCQTCFTTFPHPWKGMEKQWPRERGIIEHA